jgi:hypothetical protein
MRPRYVRLRWILVAVLLVLGGCSRATPTPSQPPPPSPVPATPAPTLIPRDHTPQPTLAVVQGTLSMQGQPAAGHVLYLAKIVHPETEGMGIAALDPVNDPRAESDTSGYYVFLNVPPGRYALGILSPIGAVLIQQADGNEIIVEAQAGQVTDLGEVQITPFV